MDASNRATPSLPMLLALAAAACLGAGLAHAQGADAGVWQQHKVTFNYLGDIDGTTYSCDGMIEDLTFLLKQSGAQINGSIGVTPCVNGFGSPSRLLAATIDFSTFMPASDESGQGPRVPGSWRTVLFSEPHSFPTLHFSDCELVSEFKQNLLQYFATQDVKANLTCIPYQAESGLYGLTFKAFVPTDTPHRAVGGG